MMAYSITAWAGTWRLPWWTRSAGLAMDGVYPQAHCVSRSAACVRLTGFWSMAVPLALWRISPVRAWPRSEERRVGKECRSRGSPYHEKKKRRKEWAERQRAGGDNGKRGRGAEWGARG